MTIQSKVDEYFDRITTLESRTLSDEYFFFTPKQRKIYEEVERAYKNESYFLLRLLNNETRKFHSEKLRSSIGSDLQIIRTQNMNFTL